MITFLWMLYLALTLFVTYLTLYDLSLKNQASSKSKMITTIISSVLWSIWYMYFLH